MDELKLKPFAAYLRVSTERQREEQTIESQEMEVKDWAEKNNITIVEWYRDDGWSGDMLARPELDRLRDSVGNGLWKGIICSDPDRLARRYSYQEYIKDELIEKGIEVICIHQAKAENAEDKILQGFQGLFAEYERVKMAERMRRGKIHKARDKKLVGHSAPYGYRYILKTKDKDGYFEVCEVETEIVKMIFHWVADEGYSIRRVVKELYKLGIKPSKRKKDYWPKSSIARMLNRKDYIGISYFNRNEAVVPKNPIKIEKYKRVKKSSRRVRPKEDWLEIPVPRIISDELFYKAKQRMKENFLYGKRNKKYPYLLTGKVYCNCGHKRVGDGVNGFHYYRSAERIYTHPKPVSGTCKCGGVNAEILDTMVWNKLLELFAKPDLIKKQVERWANKQNSSAERLQDGLESVKRAISRLDEEEQKYLKAYTSGLIDFEKFRGFVEEIKAKKETFQLQTQSLRDREPDEEVNLDSFDNVCDTLFHSMKYADISEKQEYIKSLIISIYVGERSKALVNGRIPLTNQVQNIQYESICRYCRLAQCGQINSF